ncbi:MAG: hypothetical protein COB66_07965 [Coxiella sp. (in: Bacteria)]|nr:MAG: hypothetical protein COB66_07965 [Coxiella sp. (in: g-proteobacteria)]
MKTAVIMKRSVMGMEIRQNHKTKMFNANDLHKIGNEHRKALNLSQKQLAHYFAADGTDELIKEICLSEFIPEDQVRKSTRGKSGGTWVNPILFADLAAWYSPKLKVRMLKWIIDGLMESRDESGDSYKNMNSTLKQNFPSEFDSPLNYMKVARAIAAACGVGEGKDKWENCTEPQLKMRHNIQKNIELIADLCPNAGECISKAIKKAANK